MDKMTESKAALKAAELALADALARQARLETQYYRTISEVAHDIKNPLTAMLGFLSLIRKEVAGPLGNATYREYLSIVETSSLRLLALCETLMGDYGARKGHGTGDKVADVNALVSEIRDLFRAQAKERGIKLEANVDGKFPALAVDPQDVYRALMNLVSNAVKFTPQGGKVQIQAELDKQHNNLIMVVRDSGVGMTKEQIDQVRRSHLSTVSPHGDVGTGEGLGIVNRIVNQLGGKLEIISTENRGTKVKLTIPPKLSVQS